MKRIKTISEDFEIDGLNVVQMRLVLDDALAALAKIDPGATPETVRVKIEVGDDGFDPYATVSLEYWRHENGDEEREREAANRKEKLEQLDRLKAELGL